jgi:hypothetical protein
VCIIYLLTLNQKNNRKKKMKFNFRSGEKTKCVLRNQKTDNNKDFFFFKIMNSVRPSILNRPQKSGSRHGEETADDAWVKEEKRLNARRAKLASYETQFRVTHTHQASEEERKGRIESLTKAHDMILKSHNAVKEREKQNDRNFAASQAIVLRAQAEEEAARNAARRRAAIEAMQLNRKISEERRSERVVQRKKQNEYDNVMIQETLSQKRTFLY